MSNSLDLTQAVDLSLLMKKTDTEKAKQLPIHQYNRFDC